MGLKGSSKGHPLNSYDHKQDQLPKLYLTRYLGLRHCYRSLLAKEQNRYGLFANAKNAMDCSAIHEML